MPRLVLALLIGFLVLLILGDKMRGRSSVPATPPAAAVVPHRPATAPDAGIRAPTPVAVSDGRTTPPSAPPIDRLMRLSIRRRLRAEADYTYLDSLVTIDDSLIRRWPDLGGARLRVAIVPGGPSDFLPDMVAFVKQAFDGWERQGLGVAFAFLEDTTGADITVQWVDRFGAEKAGQTDVLWDQSGRIRHASISLAIHDAAGRRISDTGLRAVALHEAGHAVGLPHSSDPADVMFPSARALEPTERDRRTAALLYQLPLGDIKDVADSVGKGVSP